MFHVPQSLTCVHLHAVFSTLDRTPFMTDPDFKHEVHAYLGGVSKKLDCPPIAIDGTEDHVHVLVRFGKTITMADWMREIKRHSSSFAKKRVPRFEWQAGYGLFAVDVGNLDAAAAYVRSQVAHHHKISFQDELRRIMREQGVEWDERYFWN
jgi:REP element-mobilizing transposase RayT